MTTDQVIDRDGTIVIRFGHHDVAVPEPLATALTELIRAGRTYVGVGSPATTRWLFPGLLPGRPITASRLGDRLSHLGIDARAARRSSLIHLAAHLPAAVLADLLHIAPTTAVRWMHDAGTDWSRYAADPARSRDTNHDEKPERSHTRADHSQGWNIALYQFVGRCADQHRAEGHGPSAGIDHAQPVHARAGRLRGPSDGCL